MSALFLVIILAAIISLKLLPAMSGQPQIFTDFIIENVSGSGLNKSGELILFWCITTGGAVLVCVLDYLRGLFLPKKIHSLYRKYEDFAEKYRLQLLFSMAIPFAVYLLIFQQFSFPLFCGILLYFICMLLKKRDIYPVLFTFILSYYAILSVCSIGCHFSTKLRLSPTRLYVFTLIIGTLLCVVFFLLEGNQKKSLHSQRLLLLLQCFLPGLFSVFLIDKYLYQSTLIRVPYAAGYYAFFLILIAASLFFLIYHTLRYWKEKRDDFICAVTPMIIFAYHSFCAAPMYAQPDQHHHGEQMIPWNQIFEHGQRLYDTYTPVSGLFPYVNGFIQHVLLDGTVTDYAPAISITMVIFCLLTMYLIYRHTDGIHAMLFALLFALPCYNRQYMVLPLLLVLTLPKLTQKPLNWFFWYILGGLLAGLYYPLFGAAVLLGAAPTALWQIVRFITGRKTRSEAADLPKQEKNIPSEKAVNRIYTIMYILLFSAIILLTPLLFRILKHTLTYSSQTVMADGIALSNQTAPDEFMPCLTGFGSLRQYLYMSLRFLLPAIGIWSFVYLLRYAVISKDTKKALRYLAGAVTLAVSYSYTLVRADTGKILSRTAPVLIAVAGIYLPILLLKEEKKHRLLFALCISLPMMLYMQVSQTKNPDIWVYPDGESQLVMDDSAKLFPYYTVPDTFVKSEDTGLPIRYQKLLGRGFMVSDQLHYITDYGRVIEKCEKISDDISYMAFDGQGFYDYLGVKCYGTGYIPVARSYRAQMEIWNSDPERLPVVFYIQPMNSYYIFREMMNCGYIYDSEDKAFYPPALYAQLSHAANSNHTVNNTASDTDNHANSIDNNNTTNITSQTTETENNAINDYRTAAEATDFGLSAVSFAKSYNSLSELFDKETICSLSAKNLPDTFTGSDYDILYVEFTDTQSPDTVLQICFQDTEGHEFAGADITCNLNGNSLLIPVGMNACWYLSSLNDFTITLKSTNKSLTTSYRELKDHPDQSSVPIKEIELISLVPTRE